MAALKLLNLLALASVAIVALSSGPLQVNALVADRAQVARHVHGHDAIAKRKRSDTSSLSASGLCKPRSSSPPTSTPAPPPPTSTTPPPAPSTTSSAAPSPTSATLSSSGKKWGLAWGVDDQYLANFARPNVGFLYSWGPSLPSGLSAYGIEGIPMLWGYNQVTEFQSTVVAGYAKYALGMNEPNEPSQSNMSPQEGVNMWMQYINPLKDQGYYLISPACTDDDAGLAWYQQFFSICQSAGCHVDAIAFHAYTINAQDLITYANTLHNTYGLPVWITEFADQNFSGVGGQASMNDVWNFAGQVATFVNNTPWLMAAFPFGAMTDLQGVNTFNSLLAGNDYPTDLGYFYFG